jgi:hypothetical protein
LHWLEADDGGRYRVAQPANPGPGDLLLNEVILASAVDPMRFSARSKSPEGPGRSTVLISTGSADPALAPRLNVRGIRLDLPVFDPTSDSSDLAIQFYLKAYRDLRNGRKNEFEQAVHEQSRAGATRSLENMTGEDNRMLLDSLKDRKLVYAILGEHFEFIFYVSNAGPSVTSLAALHEGVVIDGSKYAIRPASDQSAIDQVLSDSDLQKTLAMPIAR